MTDNFCKMQQQLNHQKSRTLGDYIMGSLILISVIISFGLMFYLQSTCQNHCNNKYEKTICIFNKIELEKNITIDDNEGIIGQKKREIKYTIYPQNNITYTYILPIKKYRQFIKEWKYKNSEEVICYWDGKDVPKFRDCVEECPSPFLL